MKKAPDILNELTSYLQISLAELASKVGYERPQAFYDVMSGKTQKISATMIDRIISVYPEISHVWLLTGDGEMLKDSVNEIEKDRSMMTPLLPISAQGGSLNDFVVSVCDVDCEKIYSPIIGADFAMTVSGDSMSPEYPSGSKILIKKINESAFIDWGRCYVLDTCNGTVIKELRPSPKDGCVKCVSLNKDQDKFAPYEIELSDVNGVYRVLMLLTEK